MRGGSFFLVLVVGLVPLLFITFIALGVGVQWVAWQPPVLWNDRFGTSNGNGATAIVFNNSNLFIAGYLNLTSWVPYLSSDVTFQSETFLAKYDSAGHRIWTSAVGDNYSSPQSTTAPISGISVWSNNIYLVANDNASTFLMKYDGSGNRSWISQFGGPHSEIRGVSAGPTGVYTLGTLDYRTELLQDHDYNGNLVWSKPLNSTVALNAGSSAVYILTTGYLLSYDQTGNQLWSQSVNCVNHCFRASLSQDNTGIYVGEDSGSIRKFASNGSVLWETNPPIAKPDGVQRMSISAGPSGIYAYVTPYFAPEFIARYDAAGMQDWRAGTHNLGSGWNWFEPPYSASGSGGVYFASQTGTYGQIEELASGQSLIFVGIDPPWSFVALGSLAGAITIGAIILARKSIRPTDQHPRPVQERRVGEVPSD